MGSWRNNLGRRRPTHDVQVQYYCSAVLASKELIKYPASEAVLLSHGPVCRDGAQGQCLLKHSQLRMAATLLLMRRVC